MSGAGDPERFGGVAAALASLVLAYASASDFGAGAVCWRASSARRRRIGAGLARDHLGDERADILARQRRRALRQPRRQLARDVGGARIAHIASALEHLERDAIELRRHVAPAPRRRIDLGVLDLIRDRARIVARPQRRADEQLPEDHAEREHVGAPVERLAVDLLGRHVANLAHHGARLGLVQLAGRLGDPEVGDFHFAGVADEHVLRRHVAVHDPERRAVAAALVVRVGEPARRLGDDVGDDGHRDAHPAPRRRFAQPPEVDAVDQLHGQVVGAVELAEVRDLHDVDVRQRAGDARLVDEHGDEVGGTVEDRQDALDRDLLLEAGRALIHGAEHLGHAALRQALDEEVLAEGDRLHGGHRLYHC